VKYSLALTKTEKDFLYKKYIKQGMLPKESSDKIKKLTINLSDLVKKLRKQNKTDDYIEDKFKEEFNKVCLRLR
jgi:hypothetical protein